jgi:hypothetical protein
MNHKGDEFMSTIAPEITSEAPTIPDTLSTKHKLVDENTYLKITAEYKLCKLIQREKSGYVRALHRRVGIGLSNSEFDSIVTKLVGLGFCSITQGKHSGEFLTLVEHKSNLAREVCKPDVLRVVENSVTLPDDCLNNTATENQ